MHIAKIVLLLLSSAVNAENICDASILISHENEALERAENAIKSENYPDYSSLNLIPLYVLGVDIYLPNRYIFSSIEGGIRAMPHLVGSYLGCEINGANVAYIPGGNLTIGPLDNCNYCSTPDGVVDSVLTKVTLNKNSVYTLFELRGPGGELLQSFITDKKEYLKIQDSNHKLHKKIYRQIELNKK